MDLTNTLPLPIVVLADDDDEDCMIFADAIAAIEANVELNTVKNGEILMQLLKKYVPDLLFLDIQMPYQDGRQCIKAIRANREYDALPVIVYTGMRNPDSVNFFFREGANFFLEKPETMGKLKIALYQILSRFSFITFKQKD
ncbi:CheY-like chemotaxis protein [Filimonas zeae]|uniref:Response regulatory domain-containing protein n=1 Tax=Filimonas zeae TaxID=1737353 RepID=A0A917ITA4_9BACT|nr:response regulator [Filimonas zeae]MDR6339580.1 CheY-like chemotaxis protein [Filimonas zeae]GGH62951.1 hypothetical protein GCM10011379_13310 [Filimonas zeae]